MFSVSIITINRNNANGLKKTIESVVEQSYPAIQYIVIDGASSDNSLSVIKEKQEKLNHWVSEPDKGIYDAMNKGLALAKGDYIMLLNSGDYLSSPEIIDQVMQLANNEDALFGNIAILKQGKLLEIKPANKIEFYKRYQHNLPPHPAILIRRDAFKRTGIFDTNYKIISDVVMIARLFSSSETSYLYIDKTITIFDNEGVSSASDNQKKIYLERKAFIKNEFPQYLNDFEQVYRSNYISRISNKIRKILNGNR